MAEKSTRALLSEVVGKVDGIMGTVNSTHGLLLMVQKERVSCEERSTKRQDHLEKETTDKISGLSLSLHTHLNEATHMGGMLLGWRHLLVAAVFIIGLFKGLKELGLW